MTGISLNHLPHHTHVLCSLVRCAVHFPILPVEGTVPFDSTTVQLFFPYVPFHLAENSHRFFHTNGKRLRYSFFSEKFQVGRTVPFVVTPERSFFSFEKESAPHHGKRSDTILYFLTSLFLFI